MASKFPAKTSALSKGLSVLESVLTHSRLSDIARVTELSPGTVHRILQDLSEQGWVHQDQDRQYRPARRLHSLAGMLREDGRIAALARPHLEELVKICGFTVVLGLLKFREIMFVAKHEGASIYHMTSRAGAMVPSYSTAVGKAALAGLSDDEVVRLLAGQELVKYAENTRTRLPDILTDLKVTRRRGWALEDSENVPRLRSIAAMVHDGSGTVIGGVGVVALEFELTDKKIAEFAPAVCQTAAAVSRELGA